MLQKQITIINKLGLHTRAAAKLVTVASHYESTIQLQNLERTADCKSIMALILLGVPKGVTLDIIISGADELEAFDAISGLINNRFGESE